MKLSELLNPNAITLKLKSPTKREVLVELVDLLEKAHGFASQGEILDRVMRREAMMSTALFPGAAIPHGKVPGIDQAGFLKAAEGAKDGCPVSGALKGNVAFELDAKLE